ncbi:hypothetical protein BJY04DRAFT_194113 [Aspergillus karnatakaensis]|uniref:Zn(II)2Cys6 transcription factor n=1 Tax=Aspergillus karnatakaensis TaxID=1810916 RepID=UPI003CCDCC73
MSMFPGRRSHRKSKAGCLQCKRRKVKCDERKPTCQKCIVHGVSCSFEDDPFLLSTAQSIERARSVPDPSPHITTPPIPSPSPLGIADLELLHHYMTSTCYTVSRTPSIQSIWRDHVPRIGFTTPFLLHAVLALSALHLAHLTPSKRATYIAQAEYHHATGMSAVIPSMQTLASDNGAAMFLFSALTSIHFCATIHHGTASSILSTEGPLSEWARLFRGTKAVIDTSSIDLRSGELSPIFLTGAYFSSIRRDPKTLQEGQMYVWELKKFITQQHAHEEALREIYIKVADQLACTLAVTLRPNILETGTVFAWLIEASGEYLDLLRQEKPTALIVFSYFCVAVQQIEWAWWTEGLSSRLMSQAYTALEEGYRIWLRWPMEQMGWSPRNLV